jgi:hypothetical protein
MLQHKHQLVEAPAACQLQVFGGTLDDNGISTKNNEQPLKNRTSASIENMITKPMELPTDSMHLPAYILGTFHLSIDLA